MKIVWLCHFANQKMKDHFNTPNINEMAPWICILIELFQNQTEVELHIVAPNVFTNKDCNFTKEGINYHFYKRIPILYNNKYLRKIYSLLKIEQITNFCWIKHKIVKNIININPDLIHLHGAENPYYSAGILPLLEIFPTLTTIQGFIRNSSETNDIIKRAIEIENIILKKTKHIGVQTAEMNEIALQINPNATIHFHNYPYKIPSEVKNNIGKKEMVDCLFFARVCKDKGIEDLLSAISSIKKTYPNISLSVIGHSGKKYLSYLKTLCSELGIESNVQFLGFFSQEDVHKYALQAKLCVLPTYHDIFPGTVIESMYMKLPVVAYAVGGIPELNINEDIVVLVDKFNIDQLSEKIIQLLNDSDLRKSMTDKAYAHACARFDDKNVVPDIIKAYKLIINQYSSK
jgi:glycosyltransferase involved in cell wall biosynthesis